MLHKFRNHEISKETEILILGTFHPDIENGANFFYSRPHNFLWKILPACFGYPDLKDANIQDKITFMNQYKIDFVDIISSLHNLPIGQQANYNDDFIDNYINQWNDIIQIINNLPNLKAVYFTRKTFNKITNIENQISIIRNYCVEKCIRFCFLETPSRYSNDRKIQGWRTTIIDQTTCL